MRRIDVECPKCGCPTAGVVGHDSDWRGQKRDLLECDHCLTQWVDNGDAPEPQADDVLFEHTRCGHCGSRQTLTTSTPGGPLGIRYHRCQDCEMTFRSVDPEFTR